MENDNKGIDMPLLNASMDSAEKELKEEEPSEPDPKTVKEAVHQMSRTWVNLSITFAIEIAIEAVNFAIVGHLND